jgi:hypothetical protein
MSSAAAEIRSAMQLFGEAQGREPVERQMDFLSNRQHFS